MDDSTSSDGDDDVTAERRSASETDVEPTSDDDLTLDELREQVEEKYDFENFGPKDMARMTPEEWDAAFDPDTWITGSELLDRTEADLKHRVVDRDVFARVERMRRPDRLVAYSDEGYAVVYQDGSVEGEGTVLRDVKPSVALCSMDDYDVPEMPEGEILPRPEAVPEGGGDLGHRVLQIVGGVQVLVGVGLMGVSLFGSLGDAAIIGFVAGLGFLVIGIVLFVVVANARLSDRFRAEEYRDRLRAVGLGSGERPEFLDEIRDRHSEFGERDDDSNDTPPQRL